MYRGFDLKIALKNDAWYNTGLELYQDAKASMKSSLDAFLSPTGKIDGTQLKNSWFPKFNADVFISHSHQDETAAITLAGWLYEYFGLKCFVDSCIWGQADLLLKAIDNKFCLHADGQTYDYNLRNKSTSHVHMMLSTAITMMIDNSECLFFMNTPNSITASTVINDNRTNSPWIFAEIVISEYIRRRPLSDYRKDLIKDMSESVRVFNKTGPEVPIDYKVYTGHLTPLDQSDLKKWLEIYRPISLQAKYPLNILYQKVKPTNELI